jgi:HEAT repeat protein
MSSANKMRDLVQWASSDLSTRYDDAWHSLVEMGPEALQHVVEVFGKAVDLDKRLALISVIGEYRTEKALHFLRTQLLSQDPETWKEALDALVRLGGNSVVTLLTSVLDSVHGEKREWIKEALEDVSYRQ